MKTVVENNVGLNRRYTITNEIASPFEVNLSQERSCFYDYGVRNQVEFSGFVKGGDSAFIDEIGRCFQ